MKKVFLIVAVCLLVLSCESSKNASDYSQRAYNNGGSNVYNSSNYGSSYSNSNSIVGRWVSVENSSMGVEFYADGTAAEFEGSERYWGNYYINGNKITIRELGSNENFTGEFILHGDLLTVAGPKDDYGQVITRLRRSR